MKWNNGDVVHGFNIMKVDHVEEVNSDVYMMAVSYTHLTLPTTSRV